MNIETESLDSGILKISLAGRMDVQGAQEIDLKFNGYTANQRAVIELRYFRMRNGRQVDRTTEYLRRGLLPASERAGIRPWAWVVNASLAAARPTSPFLRSRASSEVEQIDRVRRFSDRIALVPLLPAEPIGREKLAALTAPALSAQPTR